jgi:hypothetical protein
MIYPAGGKKVLVNLKCQKFMDHRWYQAEVSQGVSLETQAESFVSVEATLECLHSYLRLLEPYSCSVEEVVVISVGLRYYRQNSPEPEGMGVIRESVIPRDV